MLAMCVMGAMLVMLVGDVMRRAERLDEATERRRVLTAPGGLRTQHVKAQLKSIIAIRLCGRTQSILESPDHGHTHHVGDRLAWYTHH